MKSSLKILILFSLLLMSSCSLHSFQSRKYQRKNFYTLEKEYVIESSIQVENKIKEEKSPVFEVLTTKNEEQLELLSDRLYNEESDNDVLVPKSNYFSESFKDNSFKFENQILKKEKTPNEEKAKRFKKASFRFFWLFFIICSLTLIVSLLLMEYFILPFIGGVILLLMPTTLHSVFSSLVIKHTGDFELKRKTRIQFWLLLGIYTLLLIALALVIVLVFL